MHTLETRKQEFHYLENAQDFKILIKVLFVRKEITFVPKLQLRNQLFNLDSRIVLM